ncbi:hypothetical protein Shyd_93460 [Streptomyces hydrogenans]|uniref:Solute-binding protein family 3/N-terminal domain-containing protein n=1 Tax=Streptomyces hydrogenans TaxID=1873719 RepID=A0ABQ3PSG4_9ACTN|nr:hypothetical protein Shyd_93460 [Streptomyces hydrogenans]
MTTHLSRRNLLSRAAVLGGLLTVSAPLVACSRTEPGTGAPGGDADLLTALRKRGHVRVGFAGEAPYGFQDGGELAGEAPTLHREIFTALGIPELRPTLTEFGALIPGLLAGRFDVVSAGMAITPERCAKVAFSEPEFVSPTALMVREGNPKGLSDLASCAAKGVRVGVLTAASRALRKARASGRGRLSSQAAADSTRCSDGSRLPLTGSPALAGPSPPWRPGAFVR